MWTICMLNLQRPESRIRAPEAGCEPPCTMWVLRTEHSTKGASFLTPERSHQPWIDSVLKCPVAFMLGIVCFVSALKLSYCYLLDVSDSGYLKLFAWVLTIVWFSRLLRLTKAIHPHPAPPWERWEEQFCSFPLTGKPLSVLTWVLGCLCLRIKGLCLNNNKLNSNNRLKQF